MVGQEKLIEKINNLTIDNLPKSILLAGKYGSGKHTLCKYIAEKFNLQMEILDGKLNYDTIEEIYTRVYPYLYVIDGTKITLKEEASILKFLEEPLKNSFIIITCEDKSSMLDTIINRCQIWNMQEYTKDILKSFCDDEIILSVAETPGQCMEYKNSPISDMISLSEKIFNCIQNANFSNVLVLPNKLAFKDEMDKFKFDIFIKVLLNTSKRFVIEKNFDSRIYTLTNKLYKDSKIFNIDKKYLYENYLYNLRETLRG